MSSLDSIYKKIASSLEQGGAGHAHESRVDSAHYIAPAVAHELNNILAIIQGYADRLLLKHEKDLTLEPHLKLISEAARRATVIVRTARESSAPAVAKSAAPLITSTPVPTA